MLLVCSLLIMAVYHHCPNQAGVKRETRPLGEIAELERRQAMLIYRKQLLRDLNAQGTG
jgi:hypothetical protein